MANLQKAAAARTAAAITRAEAALDHMLRIGQPVTFRGVAAGAPASLDFLYRNPAIRQRIEQLRGQQQIRPAQHRDADPDQPGSVIAALTVPVQHSFSATLRPPAGIVPVYQNLSFPVNSAISGSWNSASNAFFCIRSSMNGWFAYLPPGQRTSGSFTFTANQTTYLLVASSVAPTTVQVSGTYS